MAANPDDNESPAFISRLRIALAKSRYVDGHQTDWSQQFWAIMWERGRGMNLE